MINFKRYKNIGGISLLKTLYVNFHYLPVEQAIKLPIWISRKTNLRKVGGKVSITGPITTGMILFGFDSLGFVDYRYSRAVWNVAGEIMFEGKCNFGCGTKFVVSGGGKLVVGQRVTITGMTKCIVDTSLIMEDEVLISWDVQIMDTDFHKIMDDESHKIVNPSKGIKIGKHVWIGSRSTILKGTTIPADSVVAAETLMSGSYTENKVIYGGCPAKVIKRNIQWKV